MCRNLPVLELNSGARITAASFPFNGQFVAARERWRVRIPKKLTNWATFNHNMLPDMFGTARATVEDVLRRLPLTLGENDRLESRATATCAAYMGYHGCMFASSGFTATLLAFTKIARWARQNHRTCIFLYDSGAHSSLPTGAIQAACIGVTQVDNAADVLAYAFRHNDMKHLEYILLNACPQEALVCVAIEGLYRLVLLPDPFWYACGTA